MYVLVLCFLCASSYVCASSNMYFLPCAYYRSGWALKKGQRRFLVLRPGDLLYFDKEQQGSVFIDKPKGIIQLAACTVNSVDSVSFLVRNEGDRSWVFKVSQEKQQTSTVWAVVVPFSKCCCCCFSFIFVVMVFSFFFLCAYGNDVWVMVCFCLLSFVVVCCCLYVVVVV